MAESGQVGLGREIMRIDLQSLLKLYCRVPMVSGFCQHNPEIIVDLPVTRTQ